MAQISVSLRILDASGAVLRNLDGGLSDHAINSPQLAKSVFDPYLEPLKISDGSWSLAYDGKDASSMVLANGNYVVEISSQQGGASSSVILHFTVLSNPQPLSSGLLAPNPVQKGQSFVLISWAPSQAVEIRVYDGSGSLVRSFAPGSLPPLAWDLRTDGGSQAADGIYIVSIRVPGQRHSRLFKLAVTR